MADESEPKYELQGSFNMSDADEQIDKDNKWLRLTDGESRIVRFEKNPTVNKVRESYQGTGYDRYHIQLVDVSNESLKTFSVGKKLLKQISSFVNEGYTTLTITRHGRGREDTRYDVKPILEEAEMAE
jgi:hypothetical protein